VAGTIRAMAPEQTGRFDGRIALVTGGSSGIGLATAERLAELGARVVIVDRNPPPPTVEAEFFEADIGRAGGWRRIVAEPLTRLGGLDLLVLNAGTQTETNDLTALSDEELERVLAVNLSGVVLGARAATEAMDRERGGAIVMVSSLAGLIAYPPDPIYAATKHGVVGFARAVGPQFAERGVTVNVVCPGLTDTPFLRPSQREEVVEATFPLIPVEAVAETIVERLAGAATGEIWVCQAGREAIAYSPRGVPGPRGGVRPPGQFS
jgi:NAD(P)-dependent dehydrogenase (short-subunit alcohol dehydrogenase family)